SQAQFQGPDAISAALSQVQPGTTAIIDVAQGTYNGFVVSKPNISVIGVDPGVVLQSGVTDFLGNNFSLQNVAIQPPTGDGVFLFGVNGFTISGVQVSGALQNGVNAINSSSGLIAGSNLSNNFGSGVNLIQDTSVNIVGNQLSNDSFGVNLLNFQHVSVRDNVASNNIEGILAGKLPVGSVGLITNEIADDLQVVGNLVINNNTADFLFNPSTQQPIDAPPGCGIVTFAVTNATISNNVVTGNNYLGIYISSISHGVAAQLQTEGSAAGGYSSWQNPFSTNIVVSGNVVVGNGSVGPTRPFDQFPYPNVLSLVPADFIHPSDIAWDGVVQTVGVDPNITFANNVFGTSDLHVPHVA
ncbi:MAG TPA: right-handed parallel beta-helix repeat-containing protein, partial [Gemmataceae bacterium]